MIQLTPEQIKEITDQLSFGFSVHLHKKTGNLLFLPDEMYRFGYDDGEWDADFKIVEKKPDDYHEFRKWSSHEAFEAMELFAGQVKNEGLQKRLFEALDQRKPFQRFRSVVDNNGDLREEWFAFKDRWERAYVEEMVREWMLEQGSNGSEENPG